MSTTRMNDEQGRSLCKPGEELYGTVKVGRCGFRLQYAYRTPGGTLFETVAPTLKEARVRRDRWRAHGELVGHGPSGTGSRGG